MTKFLKAKRIIGEQLDIKWDMKADNPNFGKKNTFKKSQMRSVLTTIWIPLMVAFNVTMILIFTPIYFCCCMSSKKKVTEKTPEQESKKVDEAKKAKKKN